MNCWNIAVTDGRIPPVVVPACAGFVQNWKHLLTKQNGMLWHHEGCHHLHRLSWKLRLISTVQIKTLHYYHVAHLCTWYTNWTFVKQRYEMLYAALCLLPCYQSTRSYQHLSCTQGHWVLPPVPAVSGWSGVTPWTRHHFIFPATVCLKTATEIRCQKPCVGIRHKAALFL